MESKAQHIAAIAQRLVYQKMTPENVKIRRYGKTALTDGTLQVKGLLNGTAFELRLAYTAVYRKKRGHWRLLNWQSTPYTMMTDSQIKWLGISTFAVLFGPAGVFYLERIWVVHRHRFPEPPDPEKWLARNPERALRCSHHAGVALGCASTGFAPYSKTVLLAYSLGHVLWSALVFGWCCWLRAWPWAVVLLLVVVGMPTHTFYWLSEMPQGLFFLVGLLAWMSETLDIRHWTLDIGHWKRLGSFHRFRFSVLHRCGGYGVLL